MFHHSDRSCDHKHCNSRDTMFLICHVTCPEPMLHGLYEFMGRSPTH